MAIRFALVVSAVLGFVLMSDAHRGAYDFQAFYCSGMALREHANPYLTEPLRTCEHAQTDGTYAALPANVALPAPQPPYDIALFAPLSVLPFAVAKAVWGAVLATACALAIIALVKVVRVSPALAFMAFAASLILPSFAFGQLFPLYAAACMLAALFAQRGRWALCGIAAAACLVEPHLGLPVCVTLAFWNARSRVAIAVSAAALAAIAVVTAGWHVCAEYVTAVLPLHALSEIGSDAQLSLAAALHQLGVSPAQALYAGESSYVAMLLLGVWLGRVLSLRSNDDALLVAVPAAFALIGGTFIHATEMFAAIPLALLLSRAQAYRTVASIALVLLSIPWFTVLDGGMPLAFAVLAAVVVFYEVWEAGRRQIVPAVCASAAASIALLTAASRKPYAHAALAHAAAGAYPQASWQALTQQTLSTGAAVTWALRVPSWTGLVILVSVTAAYALAEKRLTVNVN
jgi:hypothetical protein